MRLNKLTRPQRPRRRRDAGMTLLEIMIVLAIIGLILGFVGVRVVGSLDKARKRTARIGAQEIAAAAQQYMLDNNNQCPTSIQDLINSKDLVNKQYKDPWGTDFTLKCPGEKNPDAADVISPGPDKAEGTDDDIGSWH